MTRNVDHFDITKRHLKKAMILSKINSTHIQLQLSLKVCRINKYSLLIVIFSLSTSSSTALADVDEPYSYNTHVQTCL